MQITYSKKEQNERRKLHKKHYKRGHSNTKLKIAVTNRVSKCNI